PTRRSSDLRPVPPRPRSRRAGSARAPCAGRARAPARARRRPPHRRTRRSSRPTPWAQCSPGLSPPAGAVVEIHRSDGLELGLLGAEGLVDLLDVLLGERLELLLGAGALVLADLLVLDQLLDGLLRIAAGAAHGHSAVLSLVAGELDVL